MYTIFYKAQERRRIELYSPTHPYKRKTIAFKAHGITQFKLSCDLYTQEIWQGPTLILARIAIRLTSILRTFTIRP